MSDDRIDLGAIRNGHAPLTPATVAALIEAVEALRQIADRTTPNFRRANGEWAEAHERHEAVARAALARFRWEDTP